MKITKLAVPFIGTAFILLASVAAQAAHVGISIGIPVGVPAYYGPYPYPAPYPYPYYAPYYPPAAVVAAPATYVAEQTSSASNQEYWYYCPDSKTYYPYVKECASDWRQVTPQSSPQ